MFLTVLFIIYIGITMIILFPFGLLAFIFSLLSFRKSMAAIVYRIGQGWAKLIILMTGCKITVTGRENIPKKGGVCFASNHDSYFDIVLLFAYCGRPIGFIAKKELIFIPFLNIWVYLIGGFLIDRKVVRKASKTITKGVKRIKSGSGLIIFPEGSRSKGRGLLPFRPGTFKLATQAEAPIIPVAINGSYNFFEKTGRIKKTSVQITFCKPIESTSLPPEDRKLVLSDRVYNVIKEQLNNTDLT